MSHDKLTAMKTIALELEDGLAARFERAANGLGPGTRGDIGLRTGRKPARDVEEP